MAPAVLTEFTAPPVSDLVPDAQRPFAGRDVRRYWTSETVWAWDRGGSFQHSGQQLVVPTYWRAGMCDLARVTGRCPQAKGEALMQARFLAKKARLNATRQAVPPLKTQRR